MTEFQIPKIPSDSLYKFISLSGILLILFGFYQVNIKINGISIFAIITGCILSIYGFRNWFVKIQKPQDKIIKDESYKYENQKSISIHQIQFAKEFEIYQSLWKTLMEFEQDVEFVFDRVKDYEKLDQEKMDKNKNEIGEKMKEFWSNYNKVRSMYNTNKPFYPREIFDELEQVIHLSANLYVEGIFMDTIKSLKEIGIHTDCPSIFNEIIQRIENVCSKIRDRIELTSIKD